MAATTCTRPSPRPADIRLRWWAVALPVAMFAGLLAALGSGDAQAASSVPLGEVLEWLERTLLKIF
ncbi:hypothetical protein SRB5_66280 [Streptomyces sp. RB5]|uniref:Uncharacterized protein n=1 Tax=Streptomyces smaragdinus TaxID=2585196 RepID=A0A7K0CSH7_9ACTN|nr:hypothetical protein [Streptomyces smaragdinus]MQY16429.1 hypothetical protein [Streptomyces smaragdinus]